LLPGVTYFVRDGGIATGPILGEDPGEFESDKKDFIETNLQNTLSIYQRVRFDLSRTIDLDARTWNESHIGIALREIDQQLRNEIYSVREYKKTGRGAYNVSTIEFLEVAVDDLFRVVMSSNFKIATQAGQFRLLNTYAEKFLENYKTMKTQQSLAQRAESILVIDEILKQREGDKDVERLAASYVDDGTIDLLKRSFPKS
jgi:hypothetical protein